MRKMGLEPTRCNHHKILSLARLPVPTLPRIVSAMFFTSLIDKIYYNTTRTVCKHFFKIFQIKIYFEQFVKNIFPMIDLFPAAIIIERILQRHFCRNDRSQQNSTLNDTYCDSYLQVSMFIFERLERYPVTELIFFG